MPDLKESLEAAFPFLAGKLQTPRPFDNFLEVPEENFRQVFEHAIDKLGFDRVCTITGFDDLQAADAPNTMSVLYHLSNKGVMLNLRRRVPREQPVITTVTDRFPGAANYERELEDLLGFEVVGLPPGPRYPLPDNFPTEIKPLRKDWKVPTPQPKS